MFNAWEDCFIETPKSFIVHETVAFCSGNQLKEAQTMQVIMETVCKPCESTHDDALDCAEITADIVTPILTLPVVQTQEIQQKHCDTARSGKNFGNAKIY